MPQTPSVRTQHVDLLKTRPLDGHGGETGPGQQRRQRDRRHQQQHRVAQADAAQREHPGQRARPVGHPEPQGEVAPGGRQAVHQAIVEERPTIEAIARISGAVTSGSWLMLFRSVGAMMTDILNQLGGDVFAQVSKVMLVTGDVRSEAAMLDLVEQIHGEWLAPRGFRGVFSAVSTLVRSDDGLRRLAAVDPTIFEFPLECFSRRGEVLGREAAIERDG